MPAPKYLFSDLLQQMFEQRHKVFVDRLNWDLKSINGQEKDQFDTGHTIYLILIDDETGEIRSSLRLNSTIRPHLMSEMFYELCENGVPSGHEIWEISRYCNNPDIPGRTNRVHAFKELMCGVMECSLLYSWEKLTFVVGTPILPHCLSCGWDIVPLGMLTKDKKMPTGAFAVNVTPTGLLALRINAGLTGPALKIIPGKRFAA